MLTVYLWVKAVYFLFLLLLKFSVDFTALKMQFPAYRQNSHVHLNVAHLDPAGHKEDSRVGFIPLHFVTSLVTPTSIKNHLQSWLAWTHISSFNPNCNMISTKISISCDSNSQGNSCPAIPIYFIAVLHNAMELWLGPSDTAVVLLLILQTTPHCRAGDKALAN